MKKVTVLFLCFLLLSAAAATANVSRIYKDGFFSGSVRPAAPSDTLVLVSEHLDVAFPSLESDIASLQRRAMVSASYTVVNRSAAAIQVPLQFLGLNVADPRVMVNGSHVSGLFVEDTGARVEFLEKITRHRYGWQPKLYEQYFQYLDAANRGGDAIRSMSMIDLSLDGFIQTARKTQNLDRLFPEARQFSVLAFTASFAPGANVLQVSYGQGLFLEGRSSYAGGPVVQAAFDYLFYPARSWPFDPAFELLVTVKLPDVVRKGWLWDGRETPEYRTNLSLSPSYDNASRTTSLAGRFRTIPSDVFSFVIGKN